MVHYAHLRFFRLSGPISLTPCFSGVLSEGGATVNRFNGFPPPPATDGRQLKKNLRCARDRVASPVLAKELGHRSFEASSDGGDLVVHDVALAALNPRNRCLVQSNAFGSQPPREIILGHWRAAPQASLTNSPARYIFWR